MNEVTFKFLDELTGISDEDWLFLMDHAKRINGEDDKGLKKAAASYGDSWKSRGGVGAFMQFCRKFDRMDNALNPECWPAAAKTADTQLLAPMSRWCDRMIPAWDIFAALAADRRPEGILDDIRDLRRYLLLVEAEMRARGIVQANNHRDNK